MNSISLENILPSNNPEDSILTVYCVDGSGSTKNFQKYHNLCLGIYNHIITSTGSSEHKEQQQQQQQQQQQEERNAMNDIDGDDDHHHHKIILWDSHYRIISDGEFLDRTRKLSGSGGTYTSKIAEYFLKDLSKHQSNTSTTAVATADAAAASASASVKVKVNIIIITDGEVHLQGWKMLKYN